MAEFRQAFRRLRREWGFTFAFVLTLALAIGANGGVFAALDAYLFPPLPYPHTDRLAVVQNHLRKTGWMLNPPYLNFSRVQSVEASARFTSRNVTAVVDGVPQSLPALKVTPNLFAVLGVQPFLGRWPDAAAGTPGGPREVVLSYDFWQNDFGGDPKILGQPLKIDGVTYRVVGVAAQGFFFPTRYCAFWTPLDITSERNNPFSFPTGTGLVRLAHGAKLAHVQLAFNVRMKRIFSGSKGMSEQAQQYGYHIVVMPIEHWLGSMQADNLLLMQAGALVLLLLAAANLGSLALVRALRRQHEFALRMALGARRRMLVRTSLAEALPLGLVAGGLGLLMAHVAAAVLVSFGIAAADTPYRIAFSTPVIVGIVGLSLVVAVVAMLAPLTMIGNKRLDVLLKQASAHSGGSRNALRVRQSLSTLQIALAVLLLSGAALIGLSLDRMITRDPGFDVAHLTMAKLSLRGAAYASDEQKTQAWRTLQQAAAALPGIESAGVGDGVPFSGDWIRQNFKRPGAAKSDVGIIVNDVTAGKGLLQTLRVRLLAGRLLNDADAKNGHAVVVDRRFAQTVYGETNVVGRYLSKKRKIRIVGVIDSLTGKFAWQGAANGTIISPAKRFYSSKLDLIVRSPLSQAMVIRELRTMLKRVMPDQSFGKIAPMKHYVQTAAEDTTALATLLAACGLIALALASTGTYGVIAQLNRARRREFAVRIALGARPTQIERLVLGSGLALWVIGSLAGAGLAVWMALTFRDRLYQVSVFNPTPYAAAVGVIGAIVLLASWLPARLARRLDVADALHEE